MSGISPRPWRRHLVDETVIVDADGEFVAHFSMESWHESDDMYAREEKRINRNIDFVLRAVELADALEKAKGEA